jgi:uncharacterized membrane protein YobD (UPF0266 family)
MYIQWRGMRVENKLPKKKGFFFGIHFIPLSFTL